MRFKDLDISGFMIVSILLIGLCFFIYYGAVAIKITKDDGFKCTSDPLGFAVSLYNASLKDFSCTCSWIDKEGKFKQVTTTEPTLLNNYSVVATINLTAMGIRRS
jgi:hypothetical protein